MTYSGVIVISLIIIVVASLLFKKQLAKRTLMELLALSFLFVLTGGVFMVYSSLQGQQAVDLLVGYLLVTTGFLIGLLSFLFKKD